MGAFVSQAAPLGDASIPAASATSALIAALSWQPLSGVVMIGAGWRSEVPNRRACCFA
jgi:hypothetical protein